MSLADAIVFHQMLLGALGASPVTAKQYQQYQEMFATWLTQSGHPTTIAELTPELVNQFLLWYRRRPHPRRTRGGEVAVRIAADVLKRLGQVLEDNEYVSANPLRKLRRPKVTKFVRTPFTEQEIGALWGASLRTKLPQRDEAMVLMLLATGMRLGELTGMRLEKLDIVRGEVTVIGKGRRERTI